MHWHSFQITILVHITYSHNLNRDPHDEDSFILIDYYFYISNDHKHDFELQWDYISDQGFQPTWHYVWSDGCACQFKSSKPWYFVSQYPNMTRGCMMMWSFFGLGHNKGPHDDAGAMVKWFVR